MKKAIITGAGGFVGKALCKELSQSGIEVIALARKIDDEDAYFDGIQHVKYVKVVMDDYKRLSDLIEDRDVDVLFHLAWEGSSGKLRADEQVQMDNIRYTCDLIREVSKIGCKRVVYASSIMTEEVRVCVENEICPGMSALNSTAKLTAGYMGQALAGALKVEFVHAVISNIYGPGEKSPRLINSSLRKMLNGTRCSFSPGDQMYDFIYVTDAAKAFALVGDKGKNNGIYYIGNSKQRPLKEYLLEMRDRVDETIEIGLGDLDFDGVSLDFSVWDTHRLEIELGFRPEVSFCDGIDRTLEWIRKNP